MMLRPEAVLAELGWGALPGVLRGVCEGEGIKPIDDPDQVQAEDFQSWSSVPPTGLSAPQRSHLQNGDMKAYSAVAK